MQFQVSLCRCQSEGGHKKVAEYLWTKASDLRKPLARPGILIGFDVETTDRDDGTFQRNSTRAQICCKLVHCRRGRFRLILYTVTFCGQLRQARRCNMQRWLQTTKLKDQYRICIWVQLYRCYLSMQFVFVCGVLVVCQEKVLVRCGSRHGY